MDSESSSDEDFGGFNNEDVQLATRRLVAQDDTSKSEYSEPDISSDSDSESGSETNNIPDLQENPIDWTENLQQIHVPAFTRNSGPSLPSDWNPHSTPHEYFQLFFTDELLHNIVLFTNQYAKLWILKKRMSQPNYVDNEWAFDGSDDITYEELCAYLGCNIIMSVNPYRQLKHLFSSDPYLANSGIRNVYFEKVLKNWSLLLHF